ncbi:MAG: GTP-binding protein [Thermotogaceae bacterium]|nr:GTP-binding protein [Thermotogaceae bacterium]
MKCKGCGVELQTVDETVPGYISERVLNERLSDGRPVLCKRCFSMKHYGRLDAQDNPVHSLENLKVYLKTAGDILYVIDLSDFNGTFRGDILSLLTGHRVHYVLNKVDLLPLEVKIEEIKVWAVETLKAPERRIKLVSSLNGYGVDSLFTYLKESGENYTAIGVTNVGKSSLLNALARSNEITVSRFPGTTLEVTPKRLERAGITVYDTPGVFTGDRVSDLLSVSDQSVLLPRKKLERYTVQFHSERTVFAGGFVRIDAVNNSDPVGIFHLFMPESVSIHETNSSIADAQWDSWFGNFLKPPFNGLAKSALVWKREQYSLKTGQELHVNGQGWINIAKGPVSLSITLPESVRLTVRKGLVGPTKFKR